MPTAAFAQSVSDLESQIKSLLAQIQLAQTQGASSSAPIQSSLNSSSAAQLSIICPHLVRTLSLGDTGTDVANLQGFLAQNPIIYPEGTVTGYFGMLTQDAVQRWQSAYGIVTSGGPATTGYGAVGPKTRNAIEATCQTQSGDSIPQGIPSTDHTSYPVCPIAAQPATPCLGTWKSIATPQGCTIGWQCSFPLPMITATSSATSTNAPVSTSGQACPTYQLPVCPSGALIWQGMSNGCNLGYTCINYR